MGNLLKNVLNLLSVSSDPSSGKQDGSVWYNSTSNRMRVRANGADNSVAFTSDVNGSPAPFYVAGNFYDQRILTQPNTNGTNTPTLGTIYYVPQYIYSAVSIDRVGVTVSSLQAGSTMRIGLYNCSSTGTPSTRIADYGTVATTATGAQLITISQSLTAGWYFWALLSASSGSGATCVRLDAGQPLLRGGSSATAASAHSSGTESGTSLPSTATAAMGTTSTPGVFFRAA